MKNKKKLFIIGGISVAVILAVVLCIVLIPKGDVPETKPSTSETETQTDVDVQTPDDVSAETIELSNEDTDKIIDDGTGLQPILDKSETNAEKKNGGKDNSGTASPVKPATPEKNTDSGGLVIGGGQGEKYNCGVSGHHCDGPETHAYVQNLELEGCPYCGSHSCQSFYATDEWGHTCYTPSKCPKYDIHKDPVHYCQTCGKKCGDGSGGTCVQFVESCNCPNCGKHVESWTCHTCN